MPWNSKAPPAIPAAVVAAWRRNPEPATPLAKGAAIAGAAGAATGPGPAAVAPDWLQTGDDAGDVGGCLDVVQPAEGTLPRAADGRKLAGAAGGDAVAAASCRSSSAMRLWAALRAMSWMMTVCARR